MRKKADATAALARAAAALLTRVGHITEELQAAQQQARRRAGATRTDQETLARARKAD